MRRGRRREYACRGRSRDRRRLRYRMRRPAERRRRGLRLSRRDARPADRHARRAERDVRGETDAKGAPAGRWRPRPPCGGGSGVGGRAEPESLKAAVVGTSENSDGRRREQQIAFDRRMPRPPTLACPCKGGGHARSAGVPPLPTPSRIPTFAELPRPGRGPDANHLRAEEPVRRATGAWPTGRRARRRLRGPAGAQELRPGPRRLSPAALAAPRAARPPLPRRRRRRGVLRRSDWAFLTDDQRRECGSFEHATAASPIFCRGMSTTCRKRPVLHEGAPRSAGHGLDGAHLRPARGCAQMGGPDRLRGRRRPLGRLSAHPDNAALRDTKPHPSMA